MSSRKDHWENIYKTRDHAEVSWYQASPAISLELLNEIHAKPTQSVIDVGCGASLLVDNLLELGYKDITLLDLSESALALTKERLGQQADVPVYISDDITNIAFDRTFDIWHDRAVFHFLTDTNDRRKYMATLEKNLSRSGRAIIGAFSLHGPQKCSGLDVVQYDGTKMEAELPDGLELLETNTDTHTKPDGETQEFMYFIIKHKQL